MRTKIESVTEITQLFQIIRKKALIIQTPITDMMDNCGTGGDHSNSFNISTTSAFVLAGAGITVAKHGNRSISSKTGSADVLEHLGVSLFFTKHQIEEALHENNIAFLFAPHIHAKLKPHMKCRNELGIPTIFNAIGPLTNPISIQSQMLGVYNQIGRASCRERGEEEVG